MGCRNVSRIIGFSASENVRDLSLKGPEFSGTHYNDRQRDQRSIDLGKTRSVKRDT